MKALKDSPAIEVGETFIGHYFDRPEIGESFLFFHDHPWELCIATKRYCQEKYKTQWKQKLHCHYFMGY